MSLSRWLIWRDSPSGRHTLYVLAHLLFLLLAVAYGMAVGAVVT